MDIRPVMITGDHPLTAKSIASEVGIDEYVPQAKPEDKHGIVLREQANTRIVAMIGDGTNDAPALAVADVGLAMNSGTQAAKEAANMVDLESNPAKIIDVVMLGKQLLMTRGAVTTFSIANDVAKYFAIVPVLFAVVPELQAYEHSTSWITKRRTLSIDLQRDHNSASDSISHERRSLQAFKHNENFSDEHVDLWCWRSDSALHWNQTNRRTHNHALLGDQKNER